MVASQVLRAGRVQDELHGGAREHSYPDVRHCAVLGQVPDGTMTRQMAWRDPALLARLKVANKVLPIARGIQQEAPPVASSQSVHLFSGENQPIGISRLGDARLSVGIRQFMLAQGGAAQAKKVVGAGRDSTTTIEIIAYALRKRQKIGGGRFIEQHVKPFVSRV